MKHSNRTPGSINELSRRDRRRLFAAAAARGARLDAERDAFLDAQLEPGETVLARSTRHPVVTDRRILSARRHHAPPHAGEWLIEEVAYSQLSGWALGAQHDGRPLVRLDHEPIPRWEPAPAHAFLWFRWGTAEAPVDHGTTTLAFGRTTNPVFVALRDVLTARAIPRRASFVVSPEGSREDRVTIAPLTLVRPRSLQALRLRVWRWRWPRFHGRVRWAIRIPSWLLLAVPAWFINPWLVLPAIALVELAWLTFMQWQWRREQRRHRAALRGWYPEEGR